MALLAGAATSAAAPSGERPASPSRSAAGGVAARIAADLKPKPTAAAVFVAPLRSDEPAPRGADLVARLAALVAGGLAEGATFRPEPVALATAHALARGAKTIVYLEFEIARGELRATADTFAVTRNVWDRARRPAPAPSAHAFASARIDAEIRGYLAPVPLLASHVDRVATEDRDILALACGDVDDDGSLEVVTLGRRRVTVGRARKGLFSPLHTVWFKDISAIAASPLREPLGGVAILPPGADGAARIDVGITDRTHGSRLDAALRQTTSIVGVPFATSNGDTCARFEGTTLAATLAKCSPDDAGPEGEAQPPFDALTAAAIIAPDGRRRVVRAFRDPATTELRIASGTETAVIPHAGAQIAIADLDGDGEPEILSTLDVLPSALGASDGDRPPGEDALVVTSWSPGGALRERARLAVPTGVRALAACPPDAPGPAALILATPGELWIVR